MHFLVSSCIQHLLKEVLLNDDFFFFKAVLTFCACTPPLSEVLVLWDFYMAFGAHMNIICIIAQLILCRDKLLAQDR